MAYKRQIDRLPIIPKDAKEHNVICHYCIVGCGYKAYTWDDQQAGRHRARPEQVRRRSRQAAGGRDAPPGTRRRCTTSSSRTARTCTSSSSRTRTAS